MSSSEHTTRLLGWSAAGTGAFATLVQDHVAGLTVSGVAAVMIGLTGAAIVAFANIRKLWAAISEARREERLKAAQTDMEVDEIRRETLTAKIDQLTATLAASAEEHTRELEAIARHRAELLTALELSNANQAALRESLHATRNQLNTLSLERDDLRAQLGQLARESTRIENAVGRLTSGTFTPDPDAPPPPREPNP
jgi:hypothetical protein